MTRSIRWARSSSASAERTRVPKPLSALNVAAARTAPPAASAIQALRRPLIQRWLRAIDRAATGKAANPASTAPAHSDLRKSLRRTLASNRSRISRSVSFFIRVPPKTSLAAHALKTAERQQLMVWELDLYSTAKSSGDSTYFAVRPRPVVARCARWPDRPRDWKIKPRRGRLTPQTGGRTMTRCSVSLQRGNAPSLGRRRASEDLL